MSSNALGGAPLLQVEQLGVTFLTPRGTVRAVRDASLNVRRGEVLGLAGESGSGKSTTAFAAMGYLPGTTRVSGRILFEGREVADMNAAELRRLRGNRIAMVYQDPATSLNPTMRVGPQVSEVLREHLNADARQSRRATIELFESVRLAEPEAVLRRYPHELSGGQQQRVVIAMALACEPDLLILDEPTTGLDVTTQATILELIVDLKHRINAGILYVTHDLGVIAAVADRVVVMYAGETVEEASVRQLFRDPKHPYTTGLLHCVPKPPTEDGATVGLTRIPGAVFPASEPAPDACLFVSRCPMATESCSQKAPPMAEPVVGHSSRCLYPNDIAPGVWGELDTNVETGRVQQEPVLRAKDLRRFYGSWGRKYWMFGPRTRPPVRAVTDVDFKVGLGRTLGIVGESGAGKSTIARVIVGLVPRDQGQLRLKEEELAPEVDDRTDAQRAAMRMVFQNPTASLNPRLAVGHAIVRALRKFSGLNKRESQQHAEELLQAVGLDPAYLNRPPRELSGGEQQRVALAGAFAASPDIIVADEAVSALDVSVQAQVLNLLRSHQEETDTSYVFITHDLAVLRYLSDEILVLYAGHVVESGQAHKVLDTPSHPYTEALLSAAPVPDPDAQRTTIRLPGFVPTMRAEFQGCVFASRCPRKIGDVCDETTPPAQTAVGGDHVLYCHIPLEELAHLQANSSVELTKTGGVP
ncbi:dipeptide ABC transporter ATP-binding protein [Candidatus Poriferisodalis sp.]|uniref:dipeptide ABC transporter ATP-binding protein n=1 Tax=Candidatus Poriferisodalis sp. TaxID=3101277 RepID=UPI003B51B810